MIKVLTPRTLEMSLQRAPILYYDNLKLLFYILFYLTDCFFTCLILYFSYLIKCCHITSFRDIYVSFSNTGYKTSEIYIQSYVKDYKCRTLQKNLKMLSHYISDIYVSFGNTGYKTSEIYIDYHMNTIV